MYNKIAKFIGASDYLSEDMVRKGLQKIDPRLKKFFGQSAKYGYPVGAAIGFLKSQFNGSDNQVDRTLRPDEAANLETKRQNEAPEKFIGTAANIGLGAGLGGGLGTLAGLVGGQLSQGGQQNKSTSGLSTEALQQDAENMETQSSGDFLSGLEQFVAKRIQSGESIEKAAQSARNSTAYGSIVKRLEKESQMPFEEWVAHKFGGQQQGQLGQGRPDKGQFLAGLGQMGQMLQAMKGKR